MLNVGIVNDLAVARQALRSIVQQTPGFRVIWDAPDGRLAVERHRAQPADIVLLDLLMPGMDGVQATPLLLAAHPCAILIVTATTAGNRQMVFAAMSHGALDAVDTPDMRSEAMTSLLRRKLITVSRIVRQGPTQRPAQTPARPETAVEAATPQRLPRLPIVAIGASTGGPQALATILRGLPGDLAAAVLLVQHLDRQFVPGLQMWLQKETPLSVLLATHGMELAMASVFLACSDDHMVLLRRAGEYRIGYTAEPQASAFRPSADVLFESVAAAVPVPRLGVLLTGMGRDGAEGLLALRQSGGSTMAQDRQSSVVYGMPRAALEVGAVDQALPLDRIAEAIAEWVAGVSRNDTAA